MSVMRETSRSVSPIDMMGVMSTCASAGASHVRKRRSFANNKGYLLKLRYTHDEYGLRNRDREGEINLMFLYQSQKIYTLRTRVVCHGWRADSLIFVIGGSFGID